MKKVLLILVLTALAAGGVFAQTRQPAQPAAASGGGGDSLTLDLIPLFKGFMASDQDTDVFFFSLSLAFEHLIAPHLSIGPELDIYFGKVGKQPGGSDIPYFYLGIAFSARYYLESEKMEKWFIGSTLGFNLQSIDGKTKEEDGGFVGPVISLRAGYRLLLGESFIVEPSMAYYYSFYNFAPTPIGWQGGLRLGFQF